LWSIRKVIGGGKQTKEQEGTAGRGYMSAAFLQKKVVVE
jgi:hypothetical protein